MIEAIDYAVWLEARGVATTWPQVLETFELLINEITITHQEAA